MPLNIRITDASPTRLSGVVGGRVRAAQVAGRFYPADRADLAGTVDRFLAAGQDAWGIRPKAVIAPHAGYVFSGAVAGTAFAAVRPWADEITRVVILAPAHRLAVPGLAAAAADAFATPLGPVAVDGAALGRALAEPGVERIDRAFDGEHAIEVELPFVQRCFPAARIVPLLVGGADAKLVERVLARLWGGPETLIVISSDLSHYHAPADAAALDDEASRAIETARADALSGTLACGHRAIAGLLRRARALDLRATTLHRADSGDAGIAGRDRVVGYGAYAFEYAGGATLPAPLRARLGAIVGQTLARLVGGDAEPLAGLDAAAEAPPLRAWRNSFVTLERDGRLRGCVGSLTPHRPLAVDVAANAVRAAAADRRFRPLSAAELPAVRASVSILSHARPLAFADEAGLIDALRPDVDGVILQDRGRQGLFLPKVWETIPDPRDFVARLKLKAGLPADHWSADLKAWRFSTETFAAA